MNIEFFLRPFRKNSIPAESCQGRSQMQAKGPEVVPYQQKADAGTGQRPRRLLYRSLSGVAEVSQKYIARSQC